MIVGLFNVAGLELEVGTCVKFMIAYQLLRDIELRGTLIAIV